MYKVCILDDQPFVREGLKTIIDWKSLECEIVAEWETGVVAMKELERIRPDIIISDIVMPGLDGLTLMDTLNQSGLPVKVIFLTAHRNFEYAQRAIELGAVDFLVKPTDPDEVIRSVLKCIRRIHAEAGRTGAEDSSTQTGEERGRELLSLLICEKPGEGPVLLDQEQHYAVLALQFEDSSNTERMLQQSADLLKRKMNPVPSVDILTIMDKVIIVCSGHNADELDRQIIERAEEIQFWHRQFMDVSVSIGISRTLRGTSRLHRQYAEAQEALRMTFYYGNGSILTYSAKNRKETDAEKNGNDTGTRREEQLLEAVKHGREDEIVSLLENWFSEFVEQQVNETDIKFQVYKWIFHIVPHVPVDSRDPDAWEDEAKAILETHSLMEIKEKLGSTIRLFMNQFKPEQADHHQMVIQQVEQYIEQHYHDPDTSLTAVADHVHLSANYLSRLIRRKTGRTFTEWLNEHRMEEAKKLLLLPNSKSYWVAERVGIPDARYFSQLFRKHTRMTPSEYKNRNMSP